MGHDHDAGDGEFDWVNAWVAQSRPNAVTAVPAATAPAALLKADAIATATSATPSRLVPPMPDDQLMRDIAEIERVRDRLAAIPVAVPMRRMQALTLVPSRTTDPVPVVIGGVFALVLLTVFGAAAMSKLSR